jgi:hypothetical protein
MRCGCPVTEFQTSFVPIVAAIRTWGMRHLRAAG